MGINVDADVVKRLDEIRIQNNIATMEELEKQVTQGGVWTSRISRTTSRNQLLQQEVIRQRRGLEDYPGSRRGAEVLRGS